MLSKHDIRHWDLIIQSIPDHRVGATTFLLCRLKDQNERTRPGREIRGKEVSCGKKSDDIYVVATNMHHWLFNAVSVLLADLARKGKVGLLEYWESIHVRSKHDGWSTAIVTNSSEPIASYIFIDLITLQFAKPLSN